MTDRNNAISAAMDFLDRAEFEDITDPNVLSSNAYFFLADVKNMGEYIDASKATHDFIKASSEEELRAMARDAAALMLH